MFPKQGRGHVFKSGGARSEKNVAHHGWATKKILKISSSSTASDAYLNALRSQKNVFLMLI